MSKVHGLLIALIALVGFGACFAIGANAKNVRDTNYASAASACGKNKVVEVRIMEPDLDTRDLLPLCLDTATGKYSVPDIKLAKS